MSKTRFHAGRAQFVAECTLGRLAKWLRLAGFDTIYDVHTPDIDRLKLLGREGQRTILTRTRHIKDRLPSRSVIHIRHNDPIRQMGQLIQEMGWRLEDMKLLTRCSRCNQPLLDAFAQEIKHRIPEHVFQNYSVFKQCPQCQRIYWPGSHADRWKAMMQQWFE